MNNEVKQNEKLTEELLTRRVLSRLDEGIGYLKCRKIVHETLQSIREAMMNGDRIEIRECLSGRPIIRHVREGYDFKTANRMPIPQRFAYKLIPSKKLQFAGGEAWQKLIEQN